MANSPPNLKDYTDGPAKYQLQTRLPTCMNVKGICLILLGLASLALYSILLVLGDLRFKIPEFVACYLATFLLYLFSGTIVLRRNSQPHLGTILMFALLFRAVMFLSPASLSDDVYRYQWEGYLQVHGVNPYRFAPDAEELKPLRNETWTHVNNKEASAIYPPAMQLLHAGIFLAFQSVWGFKLSFLLIEALLVMVVLRLLESLNLSQSNILLYAWNPLAIIEISGSGHHDACAPTLLLASVLLYSAHKHRASVVVLAGSVLCKIYPMAVVPVFLKRIPLKHFLWFPTTLVAGYVLYAGAGRRLFSSLMYYHDKWRFNGFIYHELFGVLKQEESVELVILFALLIVVTISLTQTRDLLRQTYWITGAVLLCSPTLFPWYLIWILPYLCFFQNPAWLLLTGLVPLSYYVLINWWTLRVWQQQDLFLRLQFYPFFAILILDLLLTKKWGNPFALFDRSKLR